MQLFAFRVVHAAIATPVFKRLAVNRASWGHGDRTFAPGGNRTLELGPISLLFLILVNLAVVYYGIVLLIGDIDDTSLLKFKASLKSLLFSHDLVIPISQVR